MSKYRNLLWQLSGQGAGKFFMLLFYILLPRFIGPEEYGRFSYALALAAIAVQPIVEMGLDMVIVKWVSRGKSGIVRKALVIRIVAAVALLPLVSVVSFFLKIDGNLIFTLFLYFVILAVQNTFYSFYRGIERMKFEAVLNPVQKIITVIGLLSFAGWGIKNAALGSYSLTTAVIISLCVLVVLSPRFLHAEPSHGKGGDSPDYRSMLKEGFVLSGVAFLGIIYFRIDSVMLGAMKGNLEVGFYNVAYKIMEGFFFFPGIIMMVYFPKLAKQDFFPDIFKKLTILLGATGLLCGILLYLFSPVIIDLIYGAKFESSVPVLKTLAIVILPVFLGHLATQSLVALDRNKVYLYIACAGMLVNIALNYILIPSYGASGSAWATFITESVVVLCCGIMVWRSSPGAFRFGLGAMKN